MKPMASGKDGVVSEGQEGGPLGVWRFEIDGPLAVAVPGALEKGGWRGRKVSQEVGEWEGGRGEWE